MGATMEDDDSCCWVPLGWAGNVGVGIGNVPACTAEGAVLGPAPFARSTSTARDRSNSAWFTRSQVAFAAMAKEEDW